MLDKTVHNTQINEILSLKEDMMDSIGIYQHHDAITGTARQAVANDYSKRMHRSMVNNNKFYKKMIN